MATMAVLAGIALACRSPPVEDTGAAYDLVALLDLTTVRSETRLIDLGTPAARTFLEHGWSWDEAAGTSFVWGVGSRSTVRFFVAAARDLPVVLRCAPDEAPADEPQTVSVVVNGVTVDELRLEPGLSDYRVTLPAATLAPGWSRLEFRYGRWSPGPRVRQLAVRWDSIRFGDGEPADAAPRAGTAGATLRLPYGVQLEYYLRLPMAATLDIAELSAEGGEDARLELLLEPEGGEEELLAALAPGRDFRVELGLAAPGVARLSLRATGAGSSGGLTLSRPRVRAAVAGTVAPTAAPRANVIVYLIDALRADHVGAYGYPVPITPNIDEFAAGALVFDDAIAQSSWTKPAVASLFTGMLPPSHGVLLREHALSPRASTLAEILLAAGYRTAAFSTNPFVSRSFGLDQGFLDFIYLGAGREGTHHVFSDRVNKEVLRWLDEGPGEPFFIYVHTIDPHAPYTPPQADGGYGGGESPVPMPSCQEQQPMSERARRQLLRRYDDEIRFNDASFGRFVEALRKRGLYDDSVVVLLSDHGEAFWEHRGWQHENFLYSEVLDIPLIIKPPRGASGSAADGLAQQMDVLPTILDLLRLPVPAAVEGRTLLAAGAGQAPRAGLAYLECPSGKRLEAVLAGPWKLIRTLAPDRTVRRVELYHRRRDPGERIDEARAQPVVVQRLLELLDAQEGAQALEPRQAEIGDDLEETLRALGYVN